MTTNHLSAHKLKSAAYWPGDADALVDGDFESDDTYTMDLVDFDDEAYSMDLGKQGK